uniref:CUE domain-containing protein n=1 Tax=Anopheles maculatus TaxID=74869 RepID=A0A182STL7_9DIPT
MQNALPFYLVPVLKSVENERILPLYTSAHAYVFKVIVRLTTLRESDAYWIEPDFYGKLVYKNFIITVPFLFDLISIYSRDNKEHVSRIIETILKLQPKYIQDLKQGLSYLLSAFTIIQTRCESELSEASPSESKLNDLSLYAQDCSSVLVQLVAISTTLRQICSELNVEFAISNFYDNVLIVLYRNIQEVNKHSQYLNYLNDMRVELLETFRSIISVQLEKIMENADDSLLAADKFISILTECLANSVFVRDYKTLFDIEDDLAIVQLGYKSVDQVKYDFIQKAYARDIEPQEDRNRIKALVSSELENDPETHSVTAEQSNMENRIEQNVQYIMELLPHLEAAQIRKVVCSYDNVEEAVSVLLEQENPNSALQPAVGQDEPYIPPDPLDEFYLRTGIDRLNIYDGDEFDVMVNDKVKGIIKKGKGMPGQPKTMTALLDDKSHIQQVRHIYRQFDLVAENDLDDDEYDDSFEAMTESESRHVKLSKDARNTIVDQELDNESDSENNESEDDQETNQNQSLAFCENPELARKRYEEKLNSKYLRRHGGPAAGPREADVRGKPKGQGQDSKVLLNRRHKNENKALSGNHNRKQGASYKRNRGMLPS